MKGSTSDLLRDNCDEFIYYEDLERYEQDEQQTVTRLDAALPERKREVFSLLIEACKALRRENQEVLYASLLKETIKRKKPSFDESYYGYRSFSHMLEDADDNMIVDIERNPKSGTYVVNRFLGEEPKDGTALPRPGGSRPRAGEEAVGLHPPVAALLPPRRNPDPLAPALLPFPLPALDFNIDPCKPFEHTVSR